MEPTGVPSTSSAGEHLRQRDAGPADRGVLPIGLPERRVDRLHDGRARDRRGEGEAVDDVLVE